MNGKLAIWLTALMFAIALPAACSNAAPAKTAGDQVTELGTMAEPSAAATAAEFAATQEEVTTQNATDAEAAATVHSAENTVEAAEPLVPTTMTGAEILGESAIAIVLDNNAIHVEGQGASVDGSTVTITQAGTYAVSGTLDDGQILVDAGDDDVVRLVLNGARISNSSSAPISAIHAGKVVVVLPEGTENYLSDAATYVYEDPEEDEPNAALFSKADLVIEGVGLLKVDANYSDGIASKDGLIITSGRLQVDAVDDGIRGKDFIKIENGVITVNAGGDGLKSDEDEDAAKGYIAIKNGVFDLMTGGDGIQAETKLAILDGNFTIVSGGGSNAVIGEDDSTKALKSGATVELSGGAYTIDAADDGVHSNDSVLVERGTFTIATSDDGVHGDGAVTINGGDIDITRSYEGIEGSAIIINDGIIRVVSSDDGINVAGDDGTEMMGPPGGGPGMRQPGQPGGQTAGDIGTPMAPPQNGHATPPAPGDGYNPAMAAEPPAGGQVFSGTVEQVLHINGGDISVSADGDGIDVNGAIEMSGGSILVNGPTSNGNSAIDFDAYFDLTGGVVAAAGSAGMAQAPSSTSTQPSVLINFSSMLDAGTLVHVQTAAGEPLFTLLPAKSFQSVLFSSSDLNMGTEYEIYVGGTTTSEMVDGFTLGGEYTPGDLYDSFTPEGVVTVVGQSMMRGGRGRP
ncbi:MAG: carbohydrate-binding domain-containing protein [Caldilineaceae bacterium]